MIHTQTSPTSLIATDLAIGWQTAFDLSVDLTPIAETADMHRTWNGKLVNLADPSFRLFAVSISSGDGDMRPPALSNMWPGATFEIVPPAELGDLIAAGGQSCTLIRTPYVPSVRCFDLSFNPIPFSLDGRVLTLAAPATTTVRIFFRPILQVMVKAPWTHTKHDTKADVSWGLQCEEVGADQ